RQAVTRPGSPAPRVGPGTASITPVAPLAPMNTSATKRACVGGLNAAVRSAIVALLTVNERAVMVVDAPLQSVLQAIPNVKDPKSPDGPVNGPGGEPSATKVTPAGTPVPLMLTMSVVLTPAPLNANSTMSSDPVCANLFASDRVTETVTLAPTWFSVT